MVMWFRLECSELIDSFFSELDGVKVSFSFQPCFDVLYEVDQRLHQCSCPKAQMLGEVPESHVGVSHRITTQNK